MSHSVGMQLAILDRTPTDFFRVTATTLKAFVADDTEQGFESGELHSLTSFA